MVSKIGIKIMNYKKIKIRTKNLANKCRLKINPKSRTNNK